MDTNGHTNGHEWEPMDTNELDVAIQFVFRFSLLFPDRCVCAFLVTSHFSLHT